MTGKLFEKAVAIMTRLKAVSSVVLDTHTLLWWASSQDSISSNARRAIDSAQSLLVSTTSLWEIALLVEKKRLSLSISTDAWVDACINMSRIEVVPIDVDIAVLAPKLVMHRDPADRFIVATAVRYSAAIVTKDRQIRDLASIPTIW